MKLKKSPLSVSLRVQIPYPSTRVLDRGRIGVLYALKCPKRIEDDVGEGLQISF
jgi:hypothetical protein